MAFCFLCSKFQWIGVKGKAVFLKFQQTLLPHSAQLLGQCAPVQIEVVCQLLAVEWDLKAAGAVLNGLSGEIGQ